MSLPDRIISSSAKSTVHFTKEVADNGFLNFLRQLKAAHKGEASDIFLKSGEVAEGKIGFFKRLKESLRFTLIKLTPKKEFAEAKLSALDEEAQEKLKPLLETRMQKQLKSKDGIETLAQEAFSPVEQEQWKAIAPKLDAAASETEEAMAHQVNDLMDTKLAQGKQDIEDAFIKKAAPEAEDPVAAGAVEAVESAAPQAAQKAGTQAGAKEGAKASTSKGTGQAARTEASSEAGDSLLVEPLDDLPFRPDEVDDVASGLNGLGHDFTSPSSPLLDDNLYGGIP